ncbi:uncharacterized protein [Aegilops tauschii subsp. strangulata]|uniref:uncharacterized protein n=1 Tax=Aegilops tauschii subsp. strangulata TaxID=200361 RepID=UPI003CC85F96
MKRPYACRTLNPPMLVSELISNVSATWDKQLVQATFLPMDVQVILGIPLCTRNVPDFWAWHHEKHGFFSVKSAYNMLVATRNRREAWLEEGPGPSSSRAEERAWKHLWKTQVPGKVRMFLWRLSKYSLPTNDVQAHRHMSDSPCCGLCGARDSWHHSLVECTSSRSVWALMNEEITHKIITTTEPKAKQWLFTLMDSMSHKDFVLVAVTLLSIWYARRKAIHEAIFQSPHATHGFITSFISELEVESGEGQEVLPLQSAGMKVETFLAVLLS